MFEIYINMSNSLELNSDENIDNTNKMNVSLILCGLSILKSLKKIGK